MSLVEASSGDVFTGKLVEIRGSRNDHTKVRYVLPGESTPTVGLAKLAGSRGRCLGWREAERGYMVNTFEGYVAFLPASSLVLYEPPPPERGGFDLAWPQVPGAPGENSLDVAGEEIAGFIAEKGFCTIQMYNRPEDLGEAYALASEKEEIKTELLLGMESAYLGRDNSTKVATLDADANSLDMEDALNRVNRGLTQIGLSVRAHTPVHFGFEAWGQTNALLRFSTNAPIDDRLDVEGYKERRNIMFKVEQSYTSFIQSRRLCILYFVTNEGGDLVLFPRDQSGHQAEVKIPIAPSRVVIFRNDLLGFSYEPLGDSLALQSWVTTGQVVPLNAKKNTELHATGPMPFGKQAQILSIAARLPGNVWDCAGQWAMHIASTDAIAKHPAVRWDPDFYYMDSDIAPNFGKSYTCHGGFCNNDVLLTLDVEFFGLGLADGKALSPNQRMVLEVGYEIFSRAGYTKDRLQSQNIGVFLGDVGTDWHGIDQAWAMYQGGSFWESTKGMHASVTCGRLSWIFDLQGPVMTSDTACSASLVATHQAHNQMMHHCVGERPGEHAISDRALCAGVNVLMDPMTYVGNCAGNMLSHIGRCFTFDRTADGYQRGEGCNGLFIHYTDLAEIVDERLACLAGSAANQDGRSATLTAPNGPSQQACIRMSLFMAGLEPTHVNVAECHGTGTALGDPIEVGALQATMKSGRTFPILHTSSKTNVGHLEAGAGSTGILKCILICTACVGPPNCHFRNINPHLHVEGYPVLFDTEASDDGHNCTFAGVSSFGFGGANSRGDVFATCRRGHRNVFNTDMDLPLQLRSTQALPRMELGNHSNWRDMHNKALEEPLPNITIVGSWNGWSQAEPMEKISAPPDTDTYRANIVLGDSRIEHFQLLLDGDIERQLYPERHFASPDAEILGPASDVENRAWMIDGKADGVVPGTVYRITLVLTRRWLKWEVLSESDAKVAELWGRSFKHFYNLTGTWNDWTFSRPMQSRGVQDGVESYIGEVESGESGAVEFQVVRDKDWDQTLYPYDVDLGAGFEVSSEQSEIRGPDPWGDGMNWRMMVQPSSQLKVELVVDRKQGAFRVVAGDREWRSASLAVPVTYWITSDANHWSYSRLWPIETDESKRYRTRLCLGSLDQATFRIETNAGQSGKLLTLGEGIQAKSDENLVDATWTIKGLPGQVYEITLDLNKDDISQVVTWIQQSWRENSAVVR